MPFAVLTGLPHSLQKCPRMHGPKMWTLGTWYVYNVSFPFLSGVISINLPFVDCPGETVVIRLVHLRQGSH